MPVHLLPSSSRRTIERSPDAGALLTQPGLMRYVGARPLSVLGVEIVAVSVGWQAYVATSDVRELLGRSRRQAIRGHTSAVPHRGLRGVGCLKQLPKPVFQQFDGLPQGTKLPSPNYRDGRAQGKRWGTQHFHGVDRMIPSNKASRQQPDTITVLNER
jgi:hypothetical protein